MDPDEPIQIASDANLNDLMIRPAQQPPAQLSFMDLINMSYTYRDQIRNGQLEAAQQTKQEIEQYATQFREKFDFSQHAGAVAIWEEFDRNMATYDQELATKLSQQETQRAPRSTTPSPLTASPPPASTQSGSLDEVDLIDLDEMSTAKTEETLQAAAEVKPRAQDVQAKVKIVPVSQGASNEFSLENILASAKDLEETLQTYKESITAEEFDREKLQLQDLKAALDRFKDTYDIERSADGVKKAVKDAGTYFGNLDSLVQEIQARLNQDSDELLARVRRFKEDTPIQPELPSEQELQARLDRLREPASEDDLVARLARLKTSDPLPTPEESQEEDERVEQTLRESEASPPPGTGRAIDPELYLKNQKNIIKTLGILNRQLEALSKRSVNTPGYSAEYESLYAKYDRLFKSAWPFEGMRQDTANLTFNFNSEQQKRFLEQSATIGRQLTAYEQFSTQIARNLGRSMPNVPQASPTESTRRPPISVGPAPMVQMRGSTQPQPVLQHSGRPVPSVGPQAGGGRSASGVSGVTIAAPQNQLPLPGSAQPQPQPPQSSRQPSNPWDVAWDVDSFFSGKAAQQPQQPAPAGQAQPVATAQPIPQGGAFGQSGEAYPADDLTWNTDDEMDDLGDDFDEDNAAWGPAEYGPPPGYPQSQPPVRQGPLQPSYDLSASAYYYPYLRSPNPYDPQGVSQPVRPGMQASPYGQAALRPMPVAQNTWLGPNQNYRFVAVNEPTLQARAVNLFPPTQTPATPISVSLTHGTVYGANPNAAIQRQAVMVDQNGNMPHTFSSGYTGVTSLTTGIGHVYGDPNDTTTGADRNEKEMFTVMEYLMQRLAEGNTYFDLTPDPAKPHVAQAAKAFLISQGIPEANITFEGQAAANVQVDGMTLRYVQTAVNWMQTNVAYQQKFNDYQTAKYQTAKADALAQAAVHPSAQPGPQPVSTGSLSAAPPPLVDLGPTVSPSPQQPVQPAPSTSTRSAPSNPMASPAAQPLDRGGRPDFAAGIDDPFAQSRPKNPGSDDPASQLPSSASPPPRPTN